MLQSLFERIVNLIKSELNIPVYDADADIVDKPCIVIELDNPVTEQENADFLKYSGTVRLSYLPNKKSSIELYETSVRLDSLFLNTIYVLDQPLEITEKNSNFINSILEYSFDYQMYEEVAEPYEYMEELELVIREGDTSSEISVNISDV